MKELRDRPENPDRNRTWQYERQQYGREITWLPPTQARQTQNYPTDDAMVLMRFDLIYVIKLFPQLVQNFLAFYEILKLIPNFTRIHQ